MEESVTQEIEVEATPEEVWEAVATDDGRADWLDEEAAGRTVVVERADPPHRIVWWWWRDDEPATRVEVTVVAAPAGARVVVVEHEPASFPLTALAARLTPALALA